MKDFSATSTYYPDALPYGQASSAVEFFKQVVSTLNTWRTRRQGRRQLARLPNHMLKDIGISRIDATAEASKPFWRA